MYGEVQLAKFPPSRLHWKVAFGSFEENVKVGVGSAVAPDGPVSIVVSGGIPSTTMFRESGVGSMLPAASIARTSKVWGPSLRFAVVKGVVQAAKAAASTRHWKVAVGSFEENV